MRHFDQKDSDIRHGYILHSTCDMVENKRQRHATLPSLKIDMRHRDPPPPPSRAPKVKPVARVSVPTHCRGHNGCLDGYVVTSSDHWSSSRGPWRHVQPPYNPQFDGSKIINSLPSCKYKRNISILNTKGNINISMDIACTRFDDEGIG